MWSIGIGAATVSGSVLAPFMVRAQASPVPPALDWRRRRIFSVTQAPYGARGDGLADDRPAIQAAIDDAAAAGGGTIYLAPGTYLLKTAQKQTDVRFYLLNYYSGISIVGAGRHLTTLRAAPGMPDQTRILSADSADGTHVVSRVTFADFTVDGAADQHPDALSMVGISNVWTERVLLRGVRVERVKGTVGNQGEGVAFDSYFSSNHVYRDCEAVQTGVVTTGSGFGVTNSTGISYDGCRAAGSGHWMGFTVFRSDTVEYHDCHGFLNGQRGLNCESSNHVRYVNCRAGGTGLGNRGDGIYIYQSSNVEVVDCLAHRNQSGLVNKGSGVRISGGIFSENRLAGLAFDTEADWENSTLDANPLMTANGLAAIAVAGKPRDV